MSDEKKRPTFDAHQKSLADMVRYVNLDPQTGALTLVNFRAPSSDRAR